MKRHSLIAGLTALAMMQTCFAEPASVNVGKYLAQRGWTAYESKAKFVSPSDEIAPVMYYAKGSTVPSCGLLSGGASAPAFLEILAAEAGEQYPHCPSINDAAKFKLDGRNYLVFEYSDRDTRDEVYEQFFYVYKNEAGQYVADELLNQVLGSAGDFSRTRRAKSIPKAIDGVRLARTHAMKQSEPTLELLAGDVVSDNDGAFAVFKDKAKGSCSFVVDNGRVHNKYSSELFIDGGRCTSYLASSKLDMAGRIFYLGMFKGADAATRLAIFSVAKDTSVVRPETDLALSAVVARKVADIKSLKAYLTEREAKR